MSILANKEFDDVPPDYHYMRQLRDEFAAAALTGLLAWGAYPAVDYETYAKRAYGIADAMLARRTLVPTTAPPGAQPGAPAPTTKGQ